MGRRAVLGLSADFHDAAAALSIDGAIVAAAEQERFSRTKHDAGLPREAIAWCLEEAGIRPEELEGVCFYEKPFSTYERIVVDGASAGVAALPGLARALGTWSRTKLWIGYRVERLLADLGFPSVRLHYSEHHVSHAASAFYASPFERAAVLTIDGVGEWSTATIGVGRGAELCVHEELRYPDSLGLFYSAMTSYCGFEVNDGEYKLMGLAPFGSPRYVEALRKVVHLTPDGEFRLDQRWFAFRAGRTMTARRLADLLDGPPRPPGTPLTEREADIACSAQVVLEEAILALARRAHRLTSERSVCLAGGVALNCVAIGRLIEEGPFDAVWVQPAAGDGGGSIGAALWLWHGILGNERPPPGGSDGMSGARLGPAFSADEIDAWLHSQGVEHRRLPRSDLERHVAAAIADGAVVGWFQGRMEFGPRALGGRSILADPRDAAVAGKVNQMVKGREGFRPFAPAVLEHRAATWFDLDRPYPYMTATVTVHRDHWRCDEAEDDAGSFSERLGRVRSTIPACTHVDRSARVQTVAASDHPELHGLLLAFEAATGCPVLLNTSFNRAGEPIVCSPADALRTARAAGLDLLVLEDSVVRRADLVGAES